MWNVQWVYHCEIIMGSETKGIIYKKTYIAPEWNFGVVAIERMLCGDVRFYIFDVDQCFTMPRVTFLHPDLGIGGAERLVVDAALGLKEHGNAVNIVTTHHDKSHAFAETINGEISVTVVGDWIPRSLFNHFYALMSYIRMIYAATYIILFSDLNPDVVICDLVSVAVPILKMKIKHVIFYCHYPDQLLSKRKGFLKAIYRLPLNWLEEISICKASHIFVNSKFTAGVVKQTFKRLTLDLDILYPSLNMNYFDSFIELPVPVPLCKVINKNTVCFLSINRYERKKNVELALKALKEVEHTVSNKAWENVHLIVAGGYDSRVTENVDYLNELIKLEFDLELNGKITFLKSISDIEKISLLKICTCLIYTPSNEHFGIVPIEAMYLCKPVIAVNSGGPTETVINGKTGYLCEPSPHSFAMAMKKFILDESLSEKLGAAGRRHISSLFSFKQFSIKLNNTVNDLLK